MDPEPTFERFKITEGEARFRITEAEAKNLRLPWYISISSACPLLPLYLPGDKELEQRFWVMFDEDESPDFWVVFDGSTEGPNYSTLFEAILAAEPLAFDEGLIATERHEIHDIGGYDA